MASLEQRLSLDKSDWLSIMLEQPSQQAHRTLDTPPDTPPQSPRSTSTVEKRPIIRHRFLASLLRLHKGALCKKEVKRWDYLVDAQMGYSRIRKKYQLANNAVMDANAYMKILRAEQLALAREQTTIDTKVEKLRRNLRELRDASNKVNELSQAAMAVRKRKDRSAAHLNHITHFIFRCDFPNLARMTRNIIGKSSPENKQVGSVNEINRQKQLTKSSFLRCKTNLRTC